MMHDIMDLHTHTIASGHAFSTVYEMVQAAAQKGAELIGISDHTPAMEGAAGRQYFMVSRRVPRLLFGIRLLFGAELNILDYNGTVDLDEECLQHLDYAIASLHVECIRPGTKKENTDAFSGVMRNPRVLILGHPDDGTFEVDYDRLAFEAAQNHVLIEVNEVSVKPGSYRKNARQNAIELLSACQKYGTRIIISSDAHVAFDVMQHTAATQLLEELKFPEELIVNSSVERLTEIMSLRKGSMR